ncbi:60S ribosomal protein L27 [Acorus gramineus]|uniref:60S ribosomal protein L27 n=1 Tax=Acorus gramineus TaxID=55184 RepID=A0AAV9AM37_ACOGR|nr:60S ribosomal protein L27 [Acorus gramineus]
MSTRDRLYGYCLVVGISRYRKKVVRKDLIGEEYGEEDPRKRPSSSSSTTTTSCQPGTPSIDIGPKDVFLHQVEILSRSI